VGKKLSRAERKDQRKKTLRSPVQALRPRSAHPHGSDAEAHKEAAAASASSNGSSAGEPSVAGELRKGEAPRTSAAAGGRRRDKYKKARVAEATPSSPPSSEGAVAASEASKPGFVKAAGDAWNSKSQNEKIILVLLGVAALVALISFAGQQFGPDKKPVIEGATQETPTPAEATTAGEPALPTAPPIDSSPPTIVTAAPATPSAAPSASSSAAAAPSASAAPTSEPAKPAETAATKATTQPTTAAGSKPAQPPKKPKVVAEDPYN
jgi:hypothetical protein